MDKSLTTESVNASLAAEAGRPPAGGLGPGVLPCQPKETGLYPNVDLSIWLRSCVQEQAEPLEGVVTGRIPPWLSGSLLMNGPGKFYYGDQVVGHLFDGSALVQKYSIEKGGAVSYTCRYIRSSHFRRNLAAQKVVTSEFGTASADNKGIRKRMAFLTGDVSAAMSDNTFITVYPLRDAYFCFYESPMIHRLDPLTLETMSRVDLNRRLGLVANACHPHYDRHGNMYSLGLRVGSRGPEYVMNKFPGVPMEEGFRSREKSNVDEQPSHFDGGHTVASVRARWMMDPSYMHSFAMTDRYFVLLEQPLCVSVPLMARAHLANRPMIECMRWRPQRSAALRLVDRVTGEEAAVRFRAAAFFFLHVINAYQEDGHVVVDVASYDDPDMLRCMDIKELQLAQSNPDYARLFRGRPQRYVLPVEAATTGDPSVVGANLVTLKGPGVSGAKAARRRKGGPVWITPRQICDVGCETPTINYQGYNGKKYRYFYAITADVDDPVSAGKVYKVDTHSGAVKAWSRPNVYCAEPMFVARPGGGEEDDGVLVSAAIHGAPDVAATELVVLDAADLEDVARARFSCGGPVPKPLHGYFTGNNPFGKT